MYHLEDYSLAHLQSELIHCEVHCEEEQPPKQCHKQKPKPQTPFSILSQTLSNLNNDTIRRYNTKFNHSPEFTQIPQKKRRPIHYKRQFNSTFDQFFVPQPWYNIDSPLSPKQSPLTQIRHRNNNFVSFSKSFHLAKNNNTNYPQNYHFQHSSVSSHGERQSKTLYGKSERWKQKLNTFLTEESENYEQNFQTYKYSNQQKAKMTLQSLVHKKKHSKMSKILKLKAHSFDNTLHRQERLTSGSKQLIEALERFSNDNMLRKSIDRAVDVLKKRTHNLLFNQSKSKKILRKTSIHESQVNWISAHKIVGNRGREEGEEKKSERVVAKKSERVDELKINERVKEKREKEMRSKVVFRPRRSHLLGREGVICMQNGGNEVRGQKRGQKGSKVRVEESKERQRIDKERADRNGKESQVVKGGYSRRKLY